MDFKKIKKLVSLVETSDISSLSVEEDNLKVEIKRETTGIIQASPIQSTLVQTPPAPPTPTVTEQEPTQPSPSTDDQLISIKSPMVGTFYASPNPESKPFVTAGASIQTGEIICIIEAMKLFNEIEADMSGTIEKICVNNGDAVEFGQDLFLIRK